MSKNKSQTVATANDVPVAEPNKFATQEMPFVPPVQEAISGEDKKVLEIALLNKRLAIKEVEKATAESNVADLQYKYIILQLYMKCGLTAADAIDEQGNIFRNYQQKAGQ